MKKTGYMSLRVKLLLLCLTIIIIPFTFMGVVTYYKYIDNEKLKSKEYAEQLTRQIEMNLDRFVKDLDRVTLTTFYDELIIRILRNHAGSYGGKPVFSTIVRDRMSSFLQGLVYDRNEIRAILFFTEDGALFSNRDALSIQNHWLLSEQSWMSGVLDRDGGALLLGTHEIGYFLNMATGRAVVERQQISFSRMIKDPISEKNLGILKMDLSPTGLETAFSAIRVTPGSHLEIAAADGSIVYTQNPTAATVDDDKRAVQTVSSSVYTGLTVRLTIPYEDLTLR